MKIGVKNNTINMADNEPYKVKITATYPFPSWTSSCPGNIERKVSSSGAPRKIAGMKSRKVCVIDIDTMKAVNESAGKKSNLFNERIRKEATKFMWMPGISPVKTPHNIPITLARIISIIIFYSEYFQS